MIGVWSVANAATYVKRFLLANKADGVTYRFPDVSGAMAEVDSTLRTAAAAGDEDADLACRCLADIWYNISVAWERNQRSMEMMDSKIPISTEDRMALRIAERLLDASAAEYPPERRDRIRELIADVPGLLKTVTLPKELKEYVARLVREVGTALDEYDLTGDFKLDIAFTRLQTSLNIIAATPKDEKSQRTVMEFLQKRVFPCVAAVGFALGFSADSATVLEYLGYSPARLNPMSRIKIPNRLRTILRKSFRRQTPIRRPLNQTSDVIHHGIQHINSDIKGNAVISRQIQSHLNPLRCKLVITELMLANAYNLSKCGVFPHAYTYV